MTSNYSPTRYAGAKEFFELPEGDNPNAIWNRSIDTILDKKMVSALLKPLLDTYDEAPTPLLTYPNVGDRYWIATLNPEKPAIRCRWKDRRIDKIRFFFGNIYATQDEAVVAHVDSLLGLKVVQTDRAQA